MTKRIRQRPGAEGGFTVVELLVVIIVIGLLLAVAVPSYLGFRDRAARQAAEENVLAAAPAVQSYFDEHGTYEGMSLPVLQTLDTSVTLDGNPTVTSPLTFCIQSTVGTQTIRKNGPEAEVEEGAC